MGNCGLKPKVLSETGAPAPEELEISLLEDQKIDAAKSLINLFLQEKADKTMKEEEKITPEKIPVTEVLKTALAEAESPVTEKTKIPVTGPKSPADDLKVVKEEAVHGQKVIDDATVKERETEAKPEEVRGEAQAQ
ncbi:microtubule-associated protein-related [Raphanus sativus]|uniref:Uncharacterized protein LOC108854370 n=1 Tax=Raphanus sativus TaxID=3726 RepID=A0A6J0NFX3_RAPSA|nr:uncharacterized protein LOC108854370 [Raphanus sativus]KAJ4898713.1 microtubule-associated protein-related [Raphanus sativus]